MGAVRPRFRLAGGSPAGFSPGARSPPTARMSEQFMSRTAGASRHVGVVILNYNTIEDTRSCLDELLHTDAPNRSILVLDNGSRENEGARLHIEYGDKILVARSPINLGFAKGCNVASATLFHREKLSSLLFLNSDARIGWRDVMTLEEFMLSQPRIAAVGPRIVYGDSTPQTAGGRVDYVRGEPHWYPAPLSDLPYNVQVLHGAALLVNADAWNRIGPFDPDYFVYSEETDWCVRAAAQGWKLFCVPGCVAYHGARGSFRGKLTPLHILLGAESNPLRPQEGSEAALSRILRISSRVHRPIPG